MSWHRALDGHEILFGDYFNYFEIFNRYPVTTHASAHALTFQNALGPDGSDGAGCSL